MKSSYSLYLLVISSRRLEQYLKQVSSFNDRNKALLFTE